MGTCVPVATVIVTAAAEQLDRLTDKLGEQFHFTLTRPVLEQLNAEIKNAAHPLVRMRVETAIAELGLEGLRLS
jgi:hypothetical protein